MIRIPEPIMFLGAYVTSVNLNGDWGASSSSCTISLVEQNPDPSGVADKNGNIPDPTKKDKKIDDIQFAPATGYPMIGTACKLTIQDPEGGDPFKFAGILQRWGYEEDPQGGRRYSVTLESPGAFLDDIHVVLDKWHGYIYTSDLNLNPPTMKPLFTYASQTQEDDVKRNFAGKAEINPITRLATPKTGILFTPSNIINLFAYKENVQKGGLNAVGGKFGASDITTQGYPLSTFIEDMRGCCNVELDHPFGGKVTIGETEYDLDLSGLEEAVEKIGDLRLQGDISSLGSILTRITEHTLYDYYVYIDDPLYPIKPATPTETKLGIMREASIKFKSVSRKQPIEPKAIKLLIDKYLQLPSPTKILKSYRLGNENTSKLITQKLIIGNSATRTWVANKEHILPIWGQKGYGKNAFYYYGNSLDEYYNMFSPVTITADAISMTRERPQTTNVQEGDFLSYQTNLLELRLALAGNRNAWEIYHKLFALGLREAQEGGYVADFLFRYNYNSPIALLASFGSINKIKDLEEIFDGRNTTHDLMDTSFASAEIRTSYMFGTKDAQVDYLQRAINSRWNAVSMIAQKMYGKQFLVAIPSEPGGVENNFRWNVADQEPNYVWKTTGSAWAGEQVIDYIPDASFYNKGMGDLLPTVTYPLFNYDGYASGGIRDFSSAVLADYSSFGSQYGIIDYQTKPPSGSWDRKAIITYNGIAIDEEWGTRYFDVTKQKIDLKGLPEKDPVTGKVTKTNNVYGFVKVDVPAVPVYDEFTTEVNAFGVLAQLIFKDNTLIGKKTKVGYHNMFGSENVVDNASIPPSMMPPMAISIPQESTRYVWGPWWAFSDFSGIQKIDKDLRPEEKAKAIASAEQKAAQARKGTLSVDQMEVGPEAFGSTAVMYTEMQNLCANALTTIHSAETGYIDLAEFPKFSLGDQLNQGPAIKDMSISIDDNGISTTYNFTNWTHIDRSKMARYNYDRLTKSNDRKFQQKKEQARLDSQFRKATLKPVNQALLKSIHQLRYNELAHSNNGVFCSMQNTMWRALNQPQPGEKEYDKYPVVNAHASSTQSAMKSIGLSPEESFGSSFEQSHSPAYIWDQRYPNEHKIIFNEGISKGFDNEMDPYPPPPPPPQAGQ
jgi:hypothetical protein